jgi:hypothetical protein
VHNHCSSGLACDRTAAAAAASVLGAATVECAAILCVECAVVAMHRFLEFL